MFKKYGYVRFTSTNENLDSIIAGMDLKPEDSALAICGSGDQAIAMLEYADKVLAADHDHMQIRYAKERFEYIKRGKFRKFLLSAFDGPEKKYFKKKKYHLLYP